jgi:Mor family transcriptional regulator
MDSLDLISDDELELLYKQNLTDNHAAAIRALFQAGVDAAVAALTPRAV